MLLGFSYFAVLTLAHPRSLLPVSLLIRLSGCVSLMALKCVVSLYLRAFQSL